MSSPAVGQSPARLIGGTAALTAFVVAFLGSFLVTPVPPGAGSVYALALAVAGLATLWIVATPLVVVAALSTESNSARTQPPGF